MIRQYAFEVVDQDHGPEIAQRAFHGFERGVAVLALLGDRVFVYELSADLIEHAVHILYILRIHIHERGALETPGSHEPAAQFGGQRGLSESAIAADRRVVFMAQQPFQVQQHAAAPDKAVLGCFG